jgi:hypothetical protein
MQTAEIPYAKACGSHAGVLRGRGIAAEASIEIIQLVCSHTTGGGMVPLVTLLTRPL